MARGWSRSGMDSGSGLGGSGLMGEPLDSRRKAGRGPHLSKRKSAMAAGTLAFYFVTVVAPVCVLVAVIVDLNPGPREP